MPCICNRDLSTATVRLPRGTVRLMRCSVTPAPSATGAAPCWGCGARSLDPENCQARIAKGNASLDLEGVGSDGVDGPPQALDGSVVAGGVGAMDTLADIAAAVVDMAARLLQLGLPQLLQLGLLGLRRSELRVHDVWIPRIAKLRPRRAPRAFAAFRLATIYLPHCLLLKWVVVKYSGVPLPVAGGEFDVRRFHP